jgi:hypothetical protein
VHKKRDVLESAWPLLSGRFDCGKSMCDQRKGRSGRVNEWNIQLPPIIAPATPPKPQQNLTGEKMVDEDILRPRKEKVCSTPKNSIRAPLVARIGDERHTTSRHTDRAGEDALEEADSHRLAQGCGRAKDGAREGRAK